MNLAAKVLKGDVPAAARLISRLEDEDPAALKEMNGIYPHTGKAYIIGVTGAPGAGKSTLTDNLIGFYRDGGLSVGVIAIDPTSALTGGAILGDRVRMLRHSTDPGVFIRSLATRGWAGGLAKATVGTIHVMDAMGRDIILVETVGSGQVELDIVKAADTTLVVLTPGSGDDIQTMKAGILEAVDIFVINKADQEGAENLKTNLEAMLRLRERRPGAWQPGIVMTEAVNGKGTAELAGEIRRHRESLAAGGGMKQRQRERARLELMETVEGSVRDAMQRIDGGGYLEKLIDDLLAGKTTPSQAARTIAGRLAAELGKPENRDKG